MTTRERIDRMIAVYEESWMEYLANRAKQELEIIDAIKEGGNDLEMLPVRRYNLVRKVDE